jgi:hypothetical protein
MSTIVFHSSSLGVTEYPAAFTGLAGDFEALADGVFLVGGETDAAIAPPAAAIVSSFSFGPAATEEGRKQVPRYAYIHAQTEAVMNCVVTDSQGNAYSYDALALSQRVQRIVLGRGIRDNYLGFALSNPNGESFRIDHLETVIDESKQRKV